MTIGDLVNCSIGASAMSGPPNEGEYDSIGPA